MFLRIFGFIISGIISLVIYFEVSNVNFSSDEPNKDRLLVDLVSYVLDKLHYDPHEDHNVVCLGHRKQDQQEVYLYLAHHLKN